MFATARDLDQVEARMGARIDQVEARMGARIDQVEARVGEVEARLGARIDQVEARLGVAVSDLRAEVHRDIAATTRTLVFAQFGSVATEVGLVFAAVRV